jgi:hypothetical protein
VIIQKYAAAFNKILKDIELKDKTEWNSILLRM